MGLRHRALPDGSVGGAHIVRSLDSTFGLDEEAIKAVKQWRFRPGMRIGEAVPVEIVVEAHVHDAIRPPTNFSN